MVVIKETLTFIWIVLILKNGIFINCLTVWKKEKRNTLLSARFCLLITKLHSPHSLYLAFTPGICLSMRCSWLTPFWPVNVMNVPGSASGPDQWGVSVSAFINTIVAASGWFRGNWIQIERLHFHLGLDSLQEELCPLLRNISFL